MAKLTPNNDKFNSIPRPFVGGVDDVHKTSDVDASKFSFHHTLGTDPGQSSSGAHNHDGTTSKKVSPLAIDGIDFSDLITGFKPWTPVWTSSAAPGPVINDGILSGKFAQVGKLALFTMLWQAGATTTYGTGLWSFSVPVTPVGGEPFYTVYGVVQNTGTSRWPVTGWMTSGSGIIRVVPSSLTSTGTSGLQDGGHKGPWVAGDFLRLSGFYETG